MYTSVELRYLVTILNVYIIFSDEATFSKIYQVVCKRFHQIYNSFTGACSVAFNRFF